MRQSIAIVTPDIMGPIRNGGVGSAFYYQACSLAKSHDVTILFFPENKEASFDFQSWIHFYARRGIKLEQISEPALSSQESSFAIRSYAVYLELRTRPFDFIHFPEMGGLGYYSTLAARQGSDFLGTTLFVQVHGPTVWHLEGSGLMPKNQREIELDFLERGSVEFADVVLTPSQYMANWLSERGWKSRAPVRVLGHAPVPDESTSSFSDRGQSSQREIAFMGRFEDRKGFGEFLEALSFLPDDLQVTLWGKPAEVRGRPALTFLDEVEGRIQQKVRIETDRNHLETYEYLSRRRPLVVIPSKLENSPCAVHECLSLNLPFVWSNFGGTHELIHESDVEAGLTELSGRSIANAIEKTLKEQSPSPRASRSAQQLAKDWLDLHERAPIQRLRDVPIEADTSPDRVRNLIESNRPPIESTNDVKLMWAPDGLIVAAAAGDPLIQFELQPLTIRNPIVSAEVHSESESSFQVYYRSRNESGFAESRCISRGLEKGWNSIHFEIPCIDLAGSLRVDFGTGQGMYFLARLALADRLAP
jgi:glycosyltransferase involved in cell wall biosynthesis